MRIHADLSGLYTRLGASNKLGLLMTPGPHQDTQELQVGAFRWIMFHLTGKPVTVDSAAVKELEPQALQVFAHETPLEQQVTSVARWFVPEAQAVPENVQALSAWQSSWSPDLSRLWPEPKRGSTQTGFEINIKALLVIAIGCCWPPQRSTARTGPISC